MTQHHFTGPSSEIEAQHSLGLRVIAIYKGIKTIGLLFVAASCTGSNTSRSPTATGCAGSW